MCYFSLYSKKNLDKNLKKKCGFKKLGVVMEKIINIHIEKLPEGVFLATSDQIQGLVAQGRTVAETIEIARDVAKKLLEAQSERKHTNRLDTVKKSFDYPLVVGI